MYNPSLREEPISRPAAVIPLKHESSILDWLEATGRLIARDDVLVDAAYLDDEEEIDQLMGSDDVGFDDDDDDDDLAGIDED